MTELQLTELFAKLDALDAEPDAGNTWMDADPSVAWDDPESRHGRLAALYEEAGWEHCYHNGGGRFHYDVKLNGNGAWQAFHNKVARSISDPKATDRIAEIADGLTEGELEFWWEDLPEDDISHIPGAIPFDVDYAGGPTRERFKVWQCGRSGGYLNAPDVEDRPRVMLQLAFIAEGAREYYNSAEYGTYLAENALEQYSETMLEAMASPRPDRVEA